MTDENQTSGIRRSGMSTTLWAVNIILVIIFCVLMGLIISNKSSFNHDILAISSIVVMVAILVCMHIPVRQLSEDLDATHGKLKIITTTDPLTKVFNSTHFNSLLRIELSRAKRYERDLGCMMLDIDHFADINKQYGYPFGDEILKDVAELIKENLRITDIMARYESNKFVCLLPETNSDAVALLSKRLRGMVEGMTYEERGEPVHITISIGLTSYKPGPEDKTDIRNIIIQAEKALKIAKEGGGNRIEVFAKKEG